MPHFVPPIDRQYTIRFFKNEELEKSIGNFKDINEEADYFDFILRKAFEFVSIVKKDKSLKIDNAFNTSYPKIFDNLIITFVKEKLN